MVSECIESYQKPKDFKSFCGKKKPTFLFTDYIYYFFAI